MSFESENKNKYNNNKHLRVNLYQKFNQNDILKPRITFTEDKYNLDFISEEDQKLYMEKHRVNMYKPNSKIREKYFPHHFIPKLQNRIVKEIKRKEECLNQTDQVNESVQTDENEAEQRVKSVISIAIEVLGDLFKEIFTFNFNETEQLINDNFNKVNVDKNMKYDIPEKMNANFYLSSDRNS
jgi:hypothetical protein